MCNTINRSVRGDTPTPPPDTITPLMVLLGINTVSNSLVRYAMDRRMPSINSVGMFALTNGAYLFFLKGYLENELVKYIDNADVLNIISMSVGNTISNTAAVVIGLKHGKVNMALVQKAMIDSALTAAGSELIIKFALPIFQKKV